jgi:O-succinylbenzoic acid--CoA ligase
VRSRPLHAVLLPPGGPPGPLAALLPAALDGTGPAILPLDGDLPPARLATLLTALQPEVVHDHAGREAGRWRPAPGRAGVAPGTAVVVATSGSTGHPKGTELPAAALLASARASLERIGASPGERWLACLPMFHIAGLQVLVRSLLAGTEPVVAPGRLEPASLAASGCAYVSLVPTQLSRLIEAGADLSVLRAILLGGAAQPPGLVDRATAAGGRVVTTYGMSETCGGCVYDGVPLAGVRAETAAGGLIRIAGDVLFSGYRNDPALTARVIDRQAPGGPWFVTSDLGATGPDGRLTVRGRADDVINTGGEKVVPGEVEQALGSCPGVAEAVVIGRPDPDWGQRVTAFVVPSNPARPPALEEVRAHVRAIMGSYAAPRELRLVAAIPMLPSGKADREALRSI